VLSNPSWRSCTAGVSPDWRSSKIPMALGCIGG
jgi:hypothetical protein